MKMYHGGMVSGSHTSVSSDQTNKEWNEASFIEPTPYCDSSSQLILRAAKNIVSKCRSDKEAAVRVFNWVRDNIKYELGLTAHKATETLLYGAGSCTNKTNLMVALLRALSIPSGFRIMDVQGKNYFGIFSTPQFSPLMGEKSQHIYGAILLNGKWIKVDPTDDILLSNSVEHICVQGTPVYFTGDADAILSIDPRHIISDPDITLPSADHVLLKQRRLNPLALKVFNLYVDYLRRNCIWHDSAQSIETSFFHWLEKDDRATYEAYLNLLKEIDRMKSAHLAQQNPQS